MSAYVDTSILVKSYITEADSKDADAVLLSLPAPVILTLLQELEVTNAIHLKHARGEISAGAMSAALGDFQDDVRVGRYRRPFCDYPAVFHKAVEFSRSHAVATQCRSLDLLHVAAAAILGCRAFATFDKRQAAAAKKAGLAVVSKWKEG